MDLISEEFIDELETHVICQVNFAQYWEKKIMNKFVLNTGSGGAHVKTVCSSNTQSENDGAEVRVGVRPRSCTGIVNSARRGNGISTLI